MAFGVRICGVGPKKFHHCWNQFGRLWTVIFELKKNNQEWDFLGFWIKKGVIPGLLVIPVGKSPTMW